MYKRFIAVLGVVFLLLELAIVPFAAKLMFNDHFSELSPVEIIVLSMSFGSVFLCIVMSFSSLSERKNYPIHTFLFELMVFLCFLAPITELTTRELDSVNMPKLNMICNTLFYLIGINIAYVIMRYEFLLIDTDKKPSLKKVRMIASAAMLIDNIATLLNIPFGFFFTITPEGVYQSAPTYWLAYIPPILIIALIVIIAVKELPAGKQRMTFMLFWVFAISASALQMWHSELSLQYTGYTLSIVMIYLNIQCELDSKHAVITESKDS